MYARKIGTLKTGRLIEGGRLIQGRYIQVRLYNEATQHATKTRLLSYLCDITLVAKEGKEFKAHRNVLSAVSPFFARLFQSEMKEKKEGIIRFEEISASILEGVLEFIYTGHVEIS